MLWKRRHTLLLGSVASGALAISAIAALPFIHLHPASSAQEVGNAANDPGEDGPSDPGPMVVTTVHPRRSSTFSIADQELASVEPFFQADLRVRVAGPVKFVQKDIGDHVVKDELLVEIDVPDQLGEVAQKDAVIRQRQADLAYAHAEVKAAQAAVDTALNKVDQMKAAIRETEATCTLRLSRWTRFKAMRERNALDDLQVEEERRDYEAAVAKCDEAKAAVKTAQADVAKAEASLEAARADVKVKESLIEVARKDRERVQFLADLGKITAPFDGTIVDRRVDPGSFVQSSTTGSGETVISVARTDIVTVVAKIPDAFAPYVTTDTEALISMDDLIIEGKVTRFSPSIQNKDRTMKVEVDLYNGTEQEYHKFVARGVATLLPSVGVADALPGATLLGVGRSAWSQHVKSVRDPFPALPKLTSTGAADRPWRLLPGMTGTMRLQLHRFQNSFLLPSSAVVSRGGKRFIVEVKEGTAHLVPVRVLVDDGKLAKVAIIFRDTSPKSGVREMLRDLTGKEEIVISNQIEIADGQAVASQLTDF